MSLFRRNKAASVLLALSLGLNLFLGGWLVTQGVSPSHHDKFSVPPEQAAESIAKSLPAGDGEILRHVIAAHAPQLNAAHRDSQEAMRHLRETIVAEPLDPAALRDAFDMMRASRQSERGLFGDAIIQAIPQMTLEGRQAFIRNNLGARP